MKHPTRSCAPCSDPLNVISLRRERSPKRRVRSASVPLGSVWREPRLRALERFALGNGLPSPSGAGLEFFSAASRFRH
jgi:hypothetical protein